jgi:prophage regulatory protein
MSHVTRDPRKGLRPAPSAQKLGMGLSTLWLKVKTEPNFPKPFKLSPRVTVFYEHELDEYLAACAAKSRTA